MVISTWRVGHNFGHVLVMQKENLDFLLFFTAFWSRGHQLKRFLFETFFVFYVIFCLGEHVACIWCVNALFNHSTRKSWFRIVFYSILELSAPLEKVSFSAIFQFLLWILCLGEHVACTRCVNAFSSIQNENLDSVLFFTGFLSHGHLSKRWRFLDVFQFFFVIFMSWWARGLNLFYEWPKTTPR